MPNTEPKTYHIDSEHVLAECIEGISGLDVTHNYMVTIRDKPVCRSSAQNRLRWVWFNFLEKEMAGHGVGRNSQAWNLFFKGMFARQILIAQDEAYADFYTKADNMLSSALDKRFAKTLLLENIRTEWMSVKSMSYFLDRIDQYCLTVLSVTLPVPSGLLWATKDNKQL